MNWIIWTIGWYLVVRLDAFLRDRVLIGINPILIKRDGDVEAVRAIVLLIVWVIGMVKFW